MTDLPASSSAPAPVEPARYRLVVGSAAEAVQLVRERFGPGARVTAVRQLEAGGLKRFLQKPRLEVIVEVGPAVTAATPAGEVAEPARAAPATRAEVADIPPAAAPAVVTKRPAPDEAPPAGARHEISILRALGLDETLLARIRAESPGLDWDRTPAPEALAHLAAWLRRAYAGVPRRPAGRRRVFLGPCGVGKTTALCKALALDVFVRGQPVAVLKLDGDQPNATDGLAAFCDVLGAPLLRSPAEIGEIDEGTLLYVDVPGLGFEARAEQARLAQTLDAMPVDTRILVVHAAYEADVIADTWELGRTCGATHVVFTHADEVRRPGKLWKFILQGGLRPWFLSAGPSPAGEIEEDVFSALLARTFPPAVARAVLSQPRNTPEPAAVPSDVS